MRLGKRRLQMHGLLQFGASVRQIVERFVGDPQVIMRAGVIGMIPNHAGKLFDRSPIVSGGDVCVADIHLHSHIVRIALENPSKFPEAPSRIARPHQRVCKAVSN